MHMGRDLEKKSLEILEKCREWEEYQSMETD